MPHRVSFIRSRAIALRVVSLASVGAPVAYASQAPSMTPSALSSLPSPSAKSVHVWRKAVTDDTSEPLPVGFISAPVIPFVPAIDKAVDAEVAPIAHVEALPEIAFHHFAHLANCAPLLLTWRA